MNKLFGILFAGVCAVGLTLSGNADAHPAGHGGGYHGGHVSHGSFHYHRSVVYTTYRVPVVRTEVVPVRPVGAWTWCNGYWDWVGGSYVWVSGRYIVSVPNRVWIQPHWHYRGWVQGYGHHYVRVHGHWR